MLNVKVKRAQPIGTPMAKEAKGTPMIGGK
jgi:hypothetical protein